MDDHLYSRLLQSIAAKYPAVLPLLNDNARRALKASVESINKRYHDAITRAILKYFEGGAIADSRNTFKQACIDAFGNAFDLGWKDGGGELPIDEDALAWMEERLQEEFGYIEELFQQAKDLRKDKVFDYFAWATARADGYTGTVAAVYNAALMLVNEKQMLEWHYGDTDHCPTCARLNGQRHRASWYLSRDYIPGKPGAAMDCKGYRCQCYLTDKEGNTVTI